MLGAHLLSLGTYLVFPYFERLRRAPLISGGFLLGLARWYCSSGSASKEAQVQADAAAGVSGGSRHPALRDRAFRHRPAAADLSDR